MHFELKESRASLAYEQLTLACPTLRVNSQCYFEISAVQAGSPARLTDFWCTLLSHIANGLLPQL